jgi:hypothetical protein
MSSAALDVETALSSLIFTLSAAPEIRATALMSLARHPGLTLGEPQGRWIPGVLESAAPQDAFRELESIPGIDLVEVVYVEVTSTALASA